LQDNRRIFCSVIRFICTQKFYYF